MCALRIQTIRDFSPGLCSQWVLKYFVRIDGDIMRGCISPNNVRPHFKFKVSNLIKSELSVIIIPMKILFISLKAFFFFFTRSQNSLDVENVSPSQFDKSFFPELKSKWNLWWKLNWKRLDYGNKNELFLLFFLSIKTQDCFQLTSCLFVHLFIQQTSPEHFPCDRHCPRLRSCIYKQNGQIPIPGEFARISQQIDKIHGDKCRLESQLEGNHGSADSRAEREGQDNREAEEFPLYIRWRSLHWEGGCEEKHGVGRRVGGNDIWKKRVQKAEAVGRKKYNLPWKSREAIWMSQGCSSMRSEGGEFGSDLAMKGW